MSSIYEQYAEVIIEYARSDRSRLYPGGDHYYHFDDPRLGELLYAFHTSGSRDDHERLLDHLSENHPVARHLIGYSQLVGGPSMPPKTFQLKAGMTRSWHTNNLTPDRGEMQLAHYQAPDPKQTGEERLTNPRGQHEMHFSVSHPHAGQVYVYRMAVPNFHPEQLLPKRSPGQRRSEAAMQTAAYKKRMNEV